MYLQLLDNYWTFTKTKSKFDTAEARAWYNNNYPGDSNVKWEYFKVISVWHDTSQYGKRCKTTFEIKEDQNQGGEKKPGVNNENYGNNNGEDQNQGGKKKP